MPKLRFTTLTLVTILSAAQLPADARSRAPAPRPETVQPQSNTALPARSGQDARLRWTEVNFEVKDPEDALIRLPRDTSWLPDRMTAIWGANTIFEVPAAGRDAGGSMLRFKETTCGDSSRFAIELRTAGKPTRPLTDCSAIGSLSPDGRFVVLESDIVDLTRWVAYPIPAQAPKTGYPVAWSSDSRRIALRGSTGVVIYDLTNLRGPAAPKKRR